MDVMTDQRAAYERAKAIQAERGWVYPRKVTTREEIERARVMSFEERLLEGPRLFEAACSHIKEALQILLPHAYEEELSDVLSKVLRTVDAHEEEIWGDGGKPPIP